MHSAQEPRAALGVQGAAGPAGTLIHKREKSSKLETDTEKPGRPQMPAIGAQGKCRAEDEGAERSRVQADFEDTEERRESQLIAMRHSETPARSTGVCTGVMPAPDGFS